MTNDQVTERCKTVPPLSCPNCKKVAMVAHPSCGGPPFYLVYVCGQCGTVVSGTDYK